MTTYERAIQMYQVLIAAAHSRQLLTYEILGERVGMSKYTLGRHLEHILQYCERKGLPALTSICVSKQTGIPSYGFTDRVPRTPEGLHKEREAVYMHKWYRDRPVTVEELRNGVPRR